MSPPGPLEKKTGKWGERASSARENAGGDAGRPAGSSSFWPPDKLETFDITCSSTGHAADADGLGPIEGEGSS